MKDPRRRHFAFCMSWWIGSIIFCHAFRLCSTNRRMTWHYINLIKEKISRAEHFVCCRTCWRWCSFKAQTFIVLSSHQFQSLVVCRRLFLSSCRNADAEKSSKILYQPEVASKTAARRWINPHVDLIFSALACCNSRFQWDFSCLRIQTSFSLFLNWISFASI